MKAFALRAVGAAVATLSLPLVAHAGFLGDTATLTFNNFAFSSPVTFGGPQTVGAGVEFTGQGTDVFGQQWTISADVTDSSVIVSFNESTRAGEPNGGNIHAAPNSWVLNLSFASSVVPALSLTNYTSASRYAPGSSLNSITYPSASSVEFGFEGLYATSQYTFAGQTAAVPEPASYALMLAGVGLIGVGKLRRRR